MIVQTIIRSYWHKFGYIFKVFNLIEDGTSTVIVIENSRVLLLSEVLLLD